MAYEPTVWKSGDLVTANKLNKLEQGVANSGGIMVVHNTSLLDGAITFDKTWQEIYDALSTGSVVILSYVSPVHAQNVIINTALFDDDSNLYKVYAVGIDTEYSTDSSDGYPTYAPPM